MELGRTNLSSSLSECGSTSNGLFRPVITFVSCSSIAMKHCGFLPGVP